MPDEERRSAREPATDEVSSEGSPSAVAHEDETSRLGRQLKWSIAALVVVAGVAGGMALFRPKGPPTCPDCGEVIQNRHEIQMNGTTFGAYFCTCGHITDFDIAGEPDDRGMTLAGESDLVGIIREHNIIRCPSCAVVRARSHELSGKKWSLGEQRQYECQDCSSTFFQGMFKCRNGHWTIGNPLVYCESTDLDVFRCGTNHTFEASLGPPPLPGCGEGLSEADLESIRDALQRGVAD